MPVEIQNRTLIFLLSSIGLITLPHVYNVPTSIFAFFAVLLGWRFLAVWNKKFLPHKLVVFLLTITGLFLMFSQHHSVLGRDAGTSLFTIALSLKLLEIRNQRDLYLIVYLAFVVASSLFLYEQSILMAMYILFVCAVLFATLIIINSPQPQTKEALKKSAIIIAQALPMAMIIFVLFPRVQAPRWMLFKNNQQAKIGLNDVLEPGSISDLGLSGELVFRVKFKGSIPPPQQRYWRGPAYVYTDGKRWNQASDFSVNPYMDTPSFRGKPYEYTLLMEPQSKSWVFALDMPKQFSANVQQNATYQLISTANFSSHAEYQITSYPQYNTGFITKQEWRSNLQLPHSPSAEIKALVTQLHGFDSTPELFIQALLQHFRVEDFHYTLTPPLMDNKPIETFLFKTRYGFCSHYATAFVYLMRIAGIPARVIGGYQGGEFNKVGQFLEVRQADAHAWAEVWLENKGWVRFDPTAAIAPERIERGVNVDRQVANGEVDFSPIVLDNQAQVWLKQVQQMWQSVDYSWQRWVINYDRSSQNNFLSLFNILNVRAMLYAMMAAIALITLILAYFLLRDSRQPVDKIVLTYTKFCQKLHKVQLQRRHNEGARDFAHRACESLPQHQKEIMAITDLYIALRYGKNPAPQLLQQLNKLVATFKPSLNNPT
jgi:transglutaminase-like putative cysteine protease